MATGPHLHYEILVNNEQVNPANVKFKTGQCRSAGKQLIAFRKTHRSKIEAAAGRTCRQHTAIWRWLDDGIVNSALLIRHPGAGRGPNWFAALQAIR